MFQDRAKTYLMQYANEEKFDEVIPSIKPPIVIACGSQKYLKSKIAKVIKIELKIVPQNRMIGSAS